MQTEGKVRLTILQSGGGAALDASLHIPDPTALAPDIPVRERSDGSGPERTSSYTVYVDLPDEAEQMLLVHAYTGAFDRVSRRVATYLRTLEPVHAPRPLYGSWSAEPAVDGEVARPSDATLERLRRRGYLTRMTADEEQAYFANVALRLHQVALHRQPTYVLMPTYQCNLRCPYCFQDHMRTDPAYQHLLRTMDRATIDRIWRGMDQIDAAHGITDSNRTPRNITLFGGEPFLAESRPIIEYLLGKGGARFSAVSNATELDAYRDLLGPHGIGAIQITLDGPPDAHDRRRIYPDGSGSFERIAANITLALDAGVAISLRMNVDRENVARLPELAREFVGRGWSKYPRFSAYTAVVHASNDKTDAASTFDTWELGRALEALRAEVPEMSLIGGQDDSMLANVRRLFDQRSDPLPGFRATYCGAHSTMYVIDAFGDIYACWERTGAPEERIGAIDAEGPVRVNRATLEMWRRRNVTTNEVCRQCRYATWCGGGCAAYAEHDHGDMYHNYCDGFGRRFRATVAHAYRDFVAGTKRPMASESVCGR